jgi:hypothetical protein
VNNGERDADGQRNPTTDHADAPPECANVR